MLGTEKFGWGSAANMTLIAFGVVVCAIGEESLVMKGLLQQLVALLFEAARLTLVQILMAGKGIKLNPLQSLYYVSPACLVCLLVPFSKFSFDNSITKAMIFLNSLRTCRQAYHLLSG